MARPTQATFPDGSIFASDAAQIDQPDERWAAAYEGGEGKTPPAAGVHNYEFNRLDVFGQHLEKNGIADWDARTIYPINGWSKGSDGMLYRSRLNGNVGNNPVGGDGTKWRSLSSITAQGMFPVGSVVFRPNNPGNTEPNGGLGFGTWIKIEGRTLVGSGAFSDANGEIRSFASGGNGGEYTHTLSESEMPSHGHSGSTSSSGSHTHIVTARASESGGGGVLAGGDQDSTNDGQGTTSTSGDHTHTFNSTPTGGSAPHNNMQPYFVVDIWIRTA